MNIENPNLLIGLALGPLFFGGMLVLRRGLDFFQHASNVIRILPKADFDEHFRNEGAMRRISQVVVLWNLLSARWNRLLKTKDNKRKQVAPKSRIRISLTESVIKQRNQSTDYNSYYSVIHGIDMPNDKGQRAVNPARTNQSDDHTASL